MYGLMVAFEPTMETLVARGRNIGLNFGNVVANSKVTGYGYHGGCGSIGIKLEFWNCGGEHLKRNCPKRDEENEKNKMTMAAPTKTEVKVGQIHNMFISLVDI